ncbi:RNA-binding region RNP-1 domain-containing protein [Heterostelium album PN500]|uniref:RNA-binding region RNP-1 domain-containing protein n=1 Tax=Heterostelium pallidum (strain ATCC 26659 / Pp 5 / PN500) TaxID=670386 RepID=D3AYI5_HETP5|nr:RNA-binding region RNP-1 domain-containing protein [Heterostelium album PN500]EFA86012.1 RNA-binding region RNP-1 domain-containing protein [Heterostelium album PN500]|eukprot:XP_020438118.1 RNA-binding region RNP-1 domain-containing protein [Heterostelium album PN500]
MNFDDRYRELNFIQSNNEGTLNNNNSNRSSSNNNNNNKEYSLCALFSILYPFNSNFQQQQNDNNNGNNNSNGSVVESFIPDPLPKDHQVMWSDFEVEAESSISDLSSQASDIAMTSDVEDNDSTTGNKNHRKSTKSSGANKSDKIKKRIFIGGIKLDDLEHNEPLKRLRIEKLLHLFSSCGKIESVEPHWNKGAKKIKMIENIKKSLSFETQQAAPNPGFYVRLANATTKNNNNKNNENNNTKKIRK